MQQITKLSKGIIPLAIFIFIFNRTLIGQNSPFQLRIGYEQLYVRPGTTDDLAQKTWTMTTPVGDVFQFRTSWTHAYILGLGYDITKWWQINLNFKKFYRRYYAWDGTYLHDEWKGNAPGQFKIVPYPGDYGLPDMLHGRTLSTTSWQLGTEFHHKISKSGLWHLHYYISLNRDLYEVNLYAFDTPINYGGIGWYQDIHNDNKRVEYTTSGKITLKSENPAQSEFRASSNLALALSRKLKNGTGIRFEFGFRNIRWIKNNLLRENHWELDMNYNSYTLDENDSSIRYEVLDVSQKYKFPLYLGGYYSNVSFTFRPFRSKRDKKVTNSSQ